MNTSLFLVVFGLLFASVSANVKEDLVRRLAIADNQLSAAEKHWSTHGFDYFAEIVAEALSRLRFVATEVDKLSNNASELDADTWIKELAKIEKHIPDVTRFPALREVFKSGALYLAAIKENNHDKTLPAPEALRKKVVDIMIQEAFIKSLIHSSDSADREKAHTTLDNMYETLVNAIKSAKLPKPDEILELEVFAERKIEEFNKQGRMEEARLYKIALDRYSTVTYHLAQTYPLDTITRFNQFVEASAGHYQDYRILSAMVFFESIDCSGGKCKKN